MALAIIGTERQMDFQELAEEFLRNMRSAQKASVGKRIDGFRGEAFILYFINEMEGRTVPSHISSALGISSARVAAALNSLEERELITRRIDSEDRRKIIVELTPRGAKYVEELKMKQIERLQKTLILLGEEDAKELVRIVGRLVETFSEGQDTCDR